MEHSKSYRKSVKTPKAVHRITEEIKRAAESDARVLISGETGVGREAIAKRIHEKSARSVGPFVVMSCVDVSSDRLRSLLAGRADVGAVDVRGGTLFIDEIGELDSRLQKGLLTFLETSELDLRIIAASSRNLHREVLAGRFDADLFYRLNIIHIVGMGRRGRDREAGRRSGTFQRRFRLELGAPS